MFESVELGEEIPGQHLAAPEEPRENTEVLESRFGRLLPA